MLQISTEIGLYRKVWGKQRDRNKLRYHANQAKVNEYKQTKGCLVCREDEPCCLEFHHTDPTIKEFNIANNLSLAWEKIILEMEKCVVLCSNCHKKVHAGKLTI